jgi:hypothetical protein
MGCFTSKEKTNEEVVPDTKPKAKPSTLLSVKKINLFFKKKIYNLLILTVVVIPDILTEKKWVDQEIP